MMLQTNKAKVEEEEGKATNFVSKFLFEQYDAHAIFLFFFTSRKLKKSIMLSFVSEKKKHADYSCFLKE